MTKIIFNYFKLVKRGDPIALEIASEILPGVQNIGENHFELETRRIFFMFMMILYLPLAITKTSFI